MRHRKTSHPSLSTTSNANDPREPPGTQSDRNISTEDTIVAGHLEGCPGAVR